MNSPIHRPCRLFMFDLDGTLIDSRADITLSLNLMLGRMNMPPLSESRVSDFVGSGMQKLIERGLKEVTGQDPEAGLMEQAMPLFLEAYGNHLLDKTRLCYGVVEALDRLPWASFAVVTNKPERFSRRILEALGVANRFRVILGGDSIQKRKPDPEALFTAMEICNVSPAEAAMVGDSKLDIEAGKAAGVMTCGVLGGFRPREELEAAGCDVLLQNLRELPNYFRPPEVNY